MQNLRKCFATLRTPKSHVLKVVLNIFSSAKVTVSQQGFVHLFALLVLGMLIIGLLVGVSLVKKKQTFNSKAQTVQGCQLLTVQNNVTMQSFLSDKFTWYDSNCKQRSAQMVNNTQQDPTGRWGGYMQQYTYDLGGSVRTVNGGNFWAGGFGYLTNHWGSGATLSVNTQGTSTQTIFSGQNHAIHQFKWRLWMGGPVDATVQWFFATGRDHPVWSVTYDATPAGLDVVYADNRSPYGDIEWDGGAGATVDGVGWGDHFKFKSTQVPVTDRSGWDYSQTNTIPYAMEWINSPDAEMGTVQTQTYQQHDAGGYGFFSNWGKTSSGPMPQDFDWTYQLNQYEMGGSPTNSKRLAWGQNYSAVGQDQCWKYGEQGTPTGDCYPHQSYSVHVVLDKHSKNPVFTQVAQAENIQKATLIASIGSVVTSGPTGIARSDTVLYAPVGYNHIYGTWEVNANAQNQATFTMNPNGGTLLNPIFVIRNYTATSIPQTITINGVVKNKDVDFFPTLDTVNKVLWLTVNTTLTTTTQIAVNTTAATSSPTPTVAPTPTSTVAPTPTPTVAPTPTPSGAPVSLSLTPATQTVGTNVTFPVQIRVNSGTRPVNALQANVTYDATKLDVVTIDHTGTAFTVTAEEILTSGSIKLGKGNITAVTGDKLVATINFKSKAGIQGQAQASFATSSEVILATPPNNNILTTRNGGTYTIQVRKPGDVNLDGVVNITDLSMLLTDFGTTAQRSDFNGNGTVDITDLSILLTNYGT